jgi:hypothetical protein
MLHDRWIVGIDSTVCGRFGFQRIVATASKKSNEASGMPE